MTSRLLTARMVADHLGLTSETVLAWIRQGKLPAFRLPGGQIRVSEDQLELWLAERSTRTEDARPTIHLTEG